MLVSGAGPGVRRILVKAAKQMSQIEHNPSRPSARAALQPREKHVDSIDTPGPRASGLKWEYRPVRFGRVRSDLNQSGSDRFTVNLVRT